MDSMSHSLDSSEENAQLPGSPPSSSGGRPADLTTTASMSSDSSGDSQSSTGAAVPSPGEGSGVVEAASPPVQTEAAAAGPGPSTPTTTVVPADAPGSSGSSGYEGDTSLGSVPGEDDASRDSSSDPDEDDADASRDSSSDPDKDDADASLELLAPGAKAPEHASLSLDDVEALHPSLSPEEVQALHDEEDSETQSIELTREDTEVLRVNRYENAMTQQEEYTEAPGDTFPVEAILAKKYTDKGMRYHIKWGGHGFPKNKWRPREDVPGNQSFDFDVDYRHSRRRVRSYVRTDDHPKYVNAAKRRAPLRDLAAETKAAQKQTCFYRAGCNPQDVAPTLTIDHIDEDPSNNTPENLVACCWNCHRIKTNAYELRQDWIMRPLIRRMRKLQEEELQETYFSNDQSLWVEPVHLRVAPEQEGEGYLFHEDTLPYREMGKLPAGEDAASPAMEGAAWSDEDGRATAMEGGAWSDEDGRATANEKKLNFTKECEQAKTLWGRDKDGVSNLISKVEPPGKLSFPANFSMIFGGIEYIGNVIKMIPPKRLSLHQMYRVDFKHSVDYSVDSKGRVVALQYPDKHTHALTLEDLLPSIAPKKIPKIAIGDVLLHKGPAPDGQITTVGGGGGGGASKKGKETIYMTPEPWEPSYLGEVQAKIGDRYRVQYEQGEPVRIDMRSAKIQRFRYLVYKWHYNTPLQPGTADSDHEPVSQGMTEPLGGAAGGASAAGGGASAAGGSSEGERVANSPPAKKYRVGSGVESGGESRGESRVDAQSVDHGLMTRKLALLRLKF